MRFVSAIDPRVPRTPSASGQGAGRALDSRPIAGGARARRCNRRLARNQRGRCRARRGHCGRAGARGAVHRLGRRTGHRRRRASGRVQAGGVTYAVLGCGVDVVYPDRHAKLFDEIALAGGLLSEHDARDAAKEAAFSAAQSHRGRAGGRGRGRRSPPAVGGAHHRAARARRGTEVDRGAGQRRYRPPPGVRHGQRRRERRRDFATNGGRASSPAGRAGGPGSAARRPGRSLG